MRQITFIFFLFLLTPFSLYSAESDFKYFDFSQANYDEKILKYAVMAWELKNFAPPVCEKNNSLSQSIEYVISSQQKYTEQMKKSYQLIEAKYKDYIDIQKKPLLMIDEQLALLQNDYVTIRLIERKNLYSVIESSGLKNDQIDFKRGTGIWKCNKNIKPADVNTFLKSVGFTEKQIASGAELFGQRWKKDITLVSAPDKRISFWTEFRTNLAQVISMDITYSSTIVETPRGSAIGILQNQKNVIYHLLHQSEKQTIPSAPNVKYDQNFILAYP